MDKKTASIFAVLGMVAGSTIIRTFLEFISNPEVTNGFSPWYVTLNYYLCFLSIIVGLGIIIARIVKEPSMKWITLFAKMSPIIFLAPIIDLIISRGTGICMGYLGSGEWLMGIDFLTFFGKLTHCAISPGMRIEIALILIGIAHILWKKTKSINHLILGTFLSYVFIFASGAIVGIIGLFQGSGIDAGAWITRELGNSLLVTAHGFISKTDPYLFNESFSLFTARIHFLTLIVLGAYVWTQEHSDEFYAWIKNSRWERLLYYLFLPIIGIVTAYHFFPAISITWIDEISLLIGCIAIITNCWAAAVWNDFSDTTIDDITNTNRPLQNKIITPEKYKTYGILFFLIAITGSLLINYAFFYCIVMFQVLYGMYSYRITRWKKNFITSGITIGSIGVIMILAGYFFVSPEQNFNSTPFALLALLFITICIVSQAKDFKDVAGDRVEHIKTLPVLLGTRKASYALLVTLILWILFVAFILNSFFIALQIIPWVVIDLIVRKRIPEYIRFLILFVQIISLIVYFT
jgi:4-hydroxybenzoate polyprenyltransferase